MNTQKFKDNGYNKFPLSTDTLEFMQEQIKLLYGLSSLVGQNIIIQDSTATTDGLVIFNGEIMPLKGSRQQSISRKEESEDISFNDTTIEGARIKRYAVYASAAGIPRAAFTEIKSIKEIMDDLAEAKRHHSPKGTVIDWYGEASCENIPYGWVPCGGFFKTPGGTWQGHGEIPQAILAEKEKWSARYPNATINVDFYYGPNVSFIRFSNVGNMEIPNLSGRFIVGAGYNIGINTEYSLKDIGGESKHALTVAELPKHTHLYFGDDNLGSASQGGYAKKVCTEGTYDADSSSGSYESSWYETDVDINNNNKTYNSQRKYNAPGDCAHENRPPYYALYKLIKVI